METEKTYAFYFTFIGKGKDEKEAHENMINKVIEDAPQMLSTYEYAEEI
jgi:hypothetical protein